jgi:hypothetical protein
MPSDQITASFKNWKRAGFAATVVIAMAFPVYLTRIYIERSKPPVQNGPYYTGRASCIECHKKEDDLWKGSHHDLAMDTASSETVLGNFENFEYRHNGKTHRMFRKDGKFYVNTNGPIHLDILLCSNILYPLKTVSFSASLLPGIQKKRDGFTLATQSIRGRI